MGNKKERKRKGEDKNKKVKLKVIEVNKEIKRKKIRW